MVRAAGRFAKGGGVKDVLEFAGIVPGVDNLDLGDPGSGRIDPPVVSAFFGEGPVLPFEDIMIGKRLGGKGIEFEARMPEFVVDVL